MIHELLHRWHINADTQQYTIYTSSIIIIMTSLFRTKTQFLIHFADSGHPVPRSRSLLRA